MMRRAWILIAAVTALAGTAAWATVNEVAIVPNVGRIETAAIQESWDTYSFGNETRHAYMPVLGDCTLVMSQAKLPSDTHPVYTLGLICKAADPSFVVLVDGVEQEQPGNHRPYVDFAWTPEDVTACNLDATYYNNSRGVDAVSIEAHCWIWDEGGEGAPDGWLPEHIESAGPGMAQLWMEYGDIYYQLDDFQMEIGSYGPATPRQADDNPTYWMLASAPPDPEDGPCGEPPEDEAIDSCR